MCSSSPSFIILVYVDGRKLCVRGGKSEPRAIYRTVDTHTSRLTCERQREEGSMADYYLALTTAGGGERKKTRLIASILAGFIFGGVCR